MDKRINKRKANISNDPVAQIARPTKKSLDNQPEYPQNLFLDMIVYYKKHPLPQEQTDFLLAHIEKYINALPEKKRCILYARYRDRRTYRDIANEYGCSGERIRNILLECLENFRHMVHMQFTPSIEIPFEYMDGISTRTWTALQRKNLQTISDIIQGQYTWDDIRGIRNLGLKGEQELRDCFIRCHVVLPEGH